jgi:hypothetical protein
VVSEAIDRLRAAFADNTRGRPPARAVECGRRGNDAVDVARDADQAGHEVGQVPDQGRELVDDDHHPGQGTVAGLEAASFGKFF